MSFGGYALMEEVQRVDTENQPINQERVSRSKVSILDAKS